MDAGTGTSLGDDRLFKAHPTSSRRWSAIPRFEAAWRRGERRWPVGSSPLANDRQYQANLFRRFPSATWIGDGGESTACAQTRKALARCASAVPPKCAHFVK
jgi:hypothetical protein